MRYLILPLSVCLFAALVLPSPAAADQGAAPKPAADQHLVSLQHVSAANLISLMGWSDPTNLPTGVMSIVAIDRHNEVLITATADGLAAVKEAISMVDTPQPAVQISAVVIAAKAVDVDKGGIQYSHVGRRQTEEEAASGPKVVALLRSLKTKGDVIASSSMDAVNGTVAGFDTPDIKSAYAPYVSAVKVIVTPLIQDGGASVELDVNATTTFADQSIRGVGPSLKISISAAPKVDNGDTVVVRGLARTGPQGDQDELVLFMTPTVTAQ